MDEIIEDLSADVPAAPAADKNAISIRGDIAKVQEAMTEFDKLSAGLDELAKRYPVDLVYDVSTGAGMQEAKDHRAAWREPRLTVERLRKQAKAPVLALGKNIDARAAWLTEQLLIGETPIDQIIKAEEARKEAEKQARVMAELERVQKIEDAIGEIHMDVMVASGKPSATIMATLEALRSQTLDPLVFQDRMQQAEAARAAGVAKLEIAYKAKLHDEEEAARLAAERAELAELRAAAAAQKAKDAAAAQVEQARVATEQAAEAARLAEAREMIAKAERESKERIAAEMAELERQRKEIAASVPVAAASVETPALIVLPDPLVLEFGPEFDVAPPEDCQIEPLPQIKLGDICARLGFTLTAAFVTDTLGVQSCGTDKRAVLFAASDWPRIKAALVRHVDSLA